MSRSRASAWVSSTVALLLAILLASLQSHAQQRNGQDNNQRAGVSQSVRGKIARDGSARVLVELRLPGGPHPEATLLKTGGSNAVLGQRRNISAVRARALARIPAPLRRQIRQYD